MRKGDLFGLRVGPLNKYAFINYCRVTKVKPGAIYGWVINGEYEIMVSPDDRVTIFTPNGPVGHEGRIVYVGAFPDDAKDDYNLAIPFIELKLASAALLGRLDMSAGEYANLFRDSSNGQDEIDRKEWERELLDNIAF